MVGYHLLRSQQEDMHSLLTLKDNRMQQNAVTVRQTTQSMTSSIDYWEATPSTGHKTE